MLTILVFCFMLHNEAVAMSPGCGDDTWFAYGDEKCFKLSTKVASFYEAQEQCKLMNNMGDPYPVTLATIGSRGEHLFVDSLLRSAGMGGPVWIGLKRRLNHMTAFEWVDGSDVGYQNWDRSTLTGDMTNYCGELIVNGNNQVTSTWAAAPCRKRSFYVCQKLQRWSAYKIQDNVVRNREMIRAEKRRLNEYLSNMRSQISNEMNQWRVEIEQQQVNLRKEFVEQKEPANLEVGGEGRRTAGKVRGQFKQSLKAVTLGVPVGFVYMQLPAQPEPKVLWPQFEWQDISEEYAGLFFRVLGAESAPFGQVQNENIPKLAAIRNSPTGMNNYTNYAQFVYNNQWTKTIWTGSDTGCINQQYKGGRCYYGVQFSGVPGEVRPRNKALRVWKRI